MGKDPLKPREYCAAFINAFSSMLLLGGGLVGYLKGTLDEALNIRRGDSTTLFAIIVISAFLLASTFLILNGRPVGHSLAVITGIVLGVVVAYSGNAFGAGTETSPQVIGVIGISFITVGVNVLQWA